MFHSKVWSGHVLSAHLIQRDAKIKRFVSKEVVMLGSIQLCSVQSQAFS